MNTEYWTEARQKSWGILLAPSSLYGMNNGLMRLHEVVIFGFASPAIKWCSKTMFLSGLYDMDRRGNWCLLVGEVEDFCGLDQATTVHWMPSSPLVATWEVSPRRFSTTGTGQPTKPECRNHKTAQDSIDRKLWCSRLYHLSTLTKNNDPDYFRDNMRLINMWHMHCSKKIVSPMHMP